MRVLSVQLGVPETMPVAVVLVEAEQVSVIFVLGTNCAPLTENDEVPVTTELGLSERMTGGRFAVAL